MQTQKTICTERNSRAQSSQHLYLKKEKKIANIDLGNFAPWELIGVKQA